MSKLTLRPVELGDHERIEALKRRYELPAYTEAEWRHLYERSPLLRRRELDWTWGWVLESADGAVHGHLGNVPVEYAFDGRSVAAAAASDWVVQEEHRGHSLQLVLAFFRQSGAELLLNTTASSDYARAYAALGARQPPLAGYDRSFVWPVDRRQVAAAAMRKLGRSRDGPLAGLASALAAPVTWIGRMTTASARGLASGVERCREFDARFDAFSERLVAGGGLVCVRDREGLHWRYGRGIAGGGVYVHALSGPDGISAYMLAVKVESGGVSRALMVDYEDLEPSRQRAAALLDSVLHRCHEERVGAFYVSGLPADAQRLFSRRGGFSREIPPFGFYFKASDAALQSALGQPGTWSPRPYDGDGLCGTPHFFGLP